VDLTLRRGLESDDEEDLLLLLAEQIRLLALVLGTLDVSEEGGESLLALRLADGEFLDGRERGEVARSDRGGLPERRRSLGGATRGGGDGDGRHVNWSVDRVRETERRAEGATRISSPPLAQAQLPFSPSNLHFLFLSSACRRTSEDLQALQRTVGGYSDEEEKMLCTNSRGGKRGKEGEGRRGSERIG
jgi:hypothetical protein